MTCMKLTVPYYSQFIDIQDPFWMLRACGAISLTMVLEYHGIVSSSILTLCKEAQEKGGYDIRNGWVHEYLVNYALSHGLTAYRTEGLVSLDEICASLDKGNPVIISVEKRVLEQTRFHMIVIVGYTDDTIIYHEPESTDKEKGQYRSCSQDVCLEYFRGKAIFISKNK